MLINQVPRLHARLHSERLTVEKLCASLLFNATFGRLLASGDSRGDSVNCQSRVRSTTGHKLVLQARSRANLTCRGYSAQQQQNACIALYDAGVSTQCDVYFLLLLSTNSKLGLHLNADNTQVPTAACRTSLRT